MTTPADGAAQDFYRLAEAYYERKFERFPTYGSEVGRHEFDAELGRANEKTYLADRRDVEKTLAEIENLAPNGFTGDAWLDRRALLAELRTERMHGFELETFRRNPNRFAGGAIDGVLSLVVRNSDNLGKVAGAIESRLKQIPGYLDEAEETLDKPVPLWVKLAQQTCEGVPGFLDELREPLAKAGATPRERIDRRIDDAKKAFARFSKAVGKMKPGAADGYSIGTCRLEMLIRERLGLSISAREAEAMGRDLVDRLSAELAAEVKRFSPTKSAAEVLEEARSQWKPAAGDLIGEYRAKTFAVRDRFAAADAVGFPPGEKLNVKEVPDFLRHQIPTAAYMSPGAFDADQTGIFWVNDLSKTRKDTGDKQKEIAQHFGLEATCAHEAYPGHHLQFCTANRHPGKIRRLFSHAVFYEGWTLWCEQMMVDLKIDGSPYAKLQQLHDALWRANRILIDCGLHTGSMDYNAAVKRLCEAVGFTKARASADVNWYTSAPSVPMSYLIGKYEVLRLKERKIDRGGWTLRQFNDWLLSWGTVPQRWIEQAEG
jgi:uncharacterized protein (DUF885 family)